LTLGALLGYGRAPLATGGQPARGTPAMSSAQPTMASPEAASGPRSAGQLGLAIAAIGVVFGDIGTSPIYALRETFRDEGGLPLGASTILGVPSVMFWSLVVIVTIKYVTIVLQADNRGEGGVLAISALAQRGARTRRQTALIFALSIVGLGLFYGDGLITPAISVLSAVEGLETAQPALAPYVLPITLAVLVGLFAIQRSGTARVGALFGPVMLVWFATLAVLGAAQIVQEPGILRALDPRWAVSLFATHHRHAFVALGSMVLAVTGAEALYADMGHFGRGPIRRAWLAVVFPALVINYLGQGALLLRQPAAAAQPFFGLAPEWLLYPLIGLTTLATIIASQALISGVFSLTRQAIQLGYLPRMTVRHTSASEMGQIYLPKVNWLLATGVLLLVLGFGDSSSLAAAYGMSVSGTMGTVTILAWIVAVTRWRWNAAVAALVFGFLLAVELTYTAANTLKIAHGGWFPLLIATAFAAIVLTWRRGRRVLAERIYGHGLEVDGFIDRLDGGRSRVAGTAVFMTARPELVPNALLHNLKHNKVLHERIVVMTVRTSDEPYVPPAEQVTVERLGKGFFRVIACFGFMDEPNVPAALGLAREQGLATDMMLTSSFLGRETLIASPKPEMGPLQERLFILLSAGAQSATAYFRIPPDRVVELGTQVEI
jgi:KUP system potassium uptake protein